MTAFDQSTSPPTVKGPAIGAIPAPTTVVVPASTSVADPGSILTTVAVPAPTTAGDMHVSVTSHLAVSSLKEPVVPVSVAAPAPATTAQDSGDSDDDSETDDDSPKLNTVEDLRKGIIKTQRNKTNAPYTILLVGETGVGKSAVLMFLANVLLGNPAFKYDLTLINAQNEDGGSEQGSQTNAAHVYKLKSQNGLEITILDTPGLADTRGLQRDEIHKKSIATQIQKHISSVNAVIILANGTVPRITVGTDYALNTLSALFPKTLASNIAFLFTNVSSPLAWNFSQDSVPRVLKGAPQYLLNNPVALQKKYDKLKKDPDSKKILSAMKKAVRSGEQNALEMLVKVFDWLDGLTPQPTSDIISLYNKSQNIEQQITDTLSQMEQAAAKRKEVEKIMNSINKGTAAMDAYSQYKQTVNSYVWKQMESTSHNTLCSETGCYSNCHESCALNFSLDPSGLRGCWAMSGETCDQCGHSLWKHSHYRVLWRQVPDLQVTIDEGMKKRWEDAKDEKERNELALADMQNTLDALTQSIDYQTKKLADYAADYARLSLSGSFSAQVEKAINLLAQKFKSMQEGGVDKEQLDKVETSLEVMRKKLDVLKKANAVAKQETTGLIGYITKTAKALTRFGNSSQSAA